MKHLCSTPSLGIHLSGKGPAVLFAHGAGGGFHANFDPVLAAWQDRRSLIGLDYPGVGEVPRASEPLSLETLADQLVAAGIAAGFDRFPVVGISLGSAVALTAALRHPERVTGLVLTVGFSTPDAQLRLFSSLWRDAANREDSLGLARLLLLSAAPSGVLETLDDGALASAVQETRASYPVGGVEHIDLAERVELQDRLNDITVPTLVFAAGADRIVLPASTRALAAGIPQAQLIEYPQAGHIFNPAQADQWIADMDRFFRDRHLV